MEVMLCVPKGTNITSIEKLYPDIFEDEGYGDHLRYFIGKSCDEDPDEECGEWLTYEEAVAFCGFAEGAIPEASTLIEGNGGWAQNMISRKDFSQLALSDSEKKHLRKISKIYWANFKDGRKSKVTAREHDRLN